MTEVTGSVTRPAGDPDSYPSRPHTRCNTNRDPRSDATSSKDRPPRVLPPATAPLPSVLGIRTTRQRSRDCTRWREPRMLPPASHEPGPVNVATDRSRQRPGCLARQPATQTPCPDRGRSGEPPPIPNRGRAVWRLEHPGRLGRFPTVARLAISRSDRTLRSARPRDPPAMLPPPASRAARENRNQPRRARAPVQPSCSSPRPELAPRLRRATQYPAQTGDCKPRNAILRVLTPRFESSTYPRSPAG
jgi:hypothetical protein